MAHQDPTAALMENKAPYGGDDGDKVIGPLLHGQSTFRGVTLAQPVVKGNTFSAPWMGGNLKKGFCDLMAWKVKCGAPKFPTKAEAAAKCPSVPVDTKAVAAPPSGGEGVRATWMGHASFLVQLNGVSVLTDPVWSERASPVSFAGPKRYVDPPIEIEALPCRVDVVTVSHNHYDHLDTDTVRRLRNRFNPQWVVPYGMKAWFASEFGGDAAALGRVHELRWWECASLAVDGRAALHVTAVPVQHWSMRKAGWDRNTQLWCGFVYEAPAEAPAGVRRVFHSGDTGYCEIFRDIGNVFRRFDVALIPIGAYHPRWFLNVQHCDPAEAVRIHVDLHRPTLSLGMHWGTWILTDEPIDEPPRLLEQALIENNLPLSEFRALAHGETVDVAV